MTKKQKKKLVSIMVALIICIGGSFGVFYDDLSTPTGTYNVIRAVDGDTLVINYEGEERKVRLIGVDTEESVHPNKSKNTEEGKKASEYTKKLVEGKNITLEFDKEQEDQYGRLLAYVYINGEMLNETLVKNGYAQAKEYPPNVKYAQLLEALEVEARASKKGLWQ